ncbi:MAG: cation:proton antiporter [Lachnospiraceae bacterium]|nr:cation:proton antiporter [Lachnospiraceae bacterium]
MDGGITINGIVAMLFKQIVLGAAGGVLIAYFAVFFLKKFKFATDGFDAIFVLAIAILAYALPSAIGGNGYLSAYIVGIILGNSKISHKKSLVHFFDGVTGLMQMLLFFLLGLLAHPVELLDVFFVALGIFVFLTLVARPVSVFLLLTPFKCNLKQQLLVMWSGLRGAASVVFAVMVKISDVTTNNDLYHIAFLIVLFSIMIQGSLIPAVARKLDMIDDADDVMKTFNDYSSEVPIQFIQFRIDENHHWNQKSLSEIQLPPDTLVVLLERNGEKIVPNGNTIIQEGDKVILSAISTEVTEGVQLVEKVIEKDDEWNNMKLCDIPKESDMLIIMIQRNGTVMIPNGDTIIQEQDKLVMNMA